MPARTTISSSRSSSGNPAAFGILGYSFLADNRDKLQGSVMDGVEPTEDNIINGSYEIARKLYPLCQEAAPGRSCRASPNLSPNS